MKSIKRLFQKCSTHAAHSHRELPVLLLLVAAVLLQSILVVNCQNTGTATQLDNVDSVSTSVEAANKARIEAELQHEEEARKHAQSVVRMAATDQLNSEIITNRTRAPRIFINNIILRFHRSLELEEDEIKTIICRYPPPLAPPPPLIAAPILEKPPENEKLLPAHLSEVELILIVSALLFLTLLMLGIGMGYYCLKRRNIRVVRKVPPPFIPPPSLSSSETYYESDYDDYYRTNHGFTEEDVDLTRQAVIVPPLPFFETQRLDDRFLTEANFTDIDEDVEFGRVVAPKKPVFTTIITEDYYITPTHTTEIIDEITRQRLYVPPEKPLTTRRIEDRFVTPMSDTELVEDTTRQRTFGPPVITTHLTDDTFLHPEEDTEITEEQTTHRLYRPHEPKPTVHTVDDYFLHPEDDTELTEEIVNQRIVGPPKPPVASTRTEEDYFRDVYEIDEMVDDATTDRTFARPMPMTRTVQTSDDEYVTHSREVEEMFVDDKRMLALPPTKPTITVKNIDDFYVTNITETETNERTIRTGRSMPNLQLMPDDDDDDDVTERVTETERITKAGFDVTLRSIPQRPRGPSSSPPPPPAPSSPPYKPTKTTTTTTIDDTTTIEQTSTVTRETYKYEQVLNILDNPPPNRVPDLEEHFPPPKREKLRTVIITDEVFRTIIIESSTVEEYSERIIRHPTYGPLFEPPTWEVIFRLLSLPEVVDFPTTFPQQRKPPLGSIRSFASGFSAHEVRSVTEEDVNFSRRRMMILTGLQSCPILGTLRYRPPTMRPSSRHLPAGDHGNGYRLIPNHPNRQPSTTSSVFGGRRLVDPYRPSYTAASPSMRRRFGSIGRSYSPDIDALSLEPASTACFRGAATTSSSYVQSQLYSSATGSTTAQSSRYQQLQQQQQSAEDREEIKSTTETDVYDWKRYS
ncbi:hypothetical protein TYRP_001326 [Tyrophagus putrescentiae]|nr:hypothetical protein TYRP_001326 [Tyrophagus putrescentiae]